MTDEKKPGGEQYEMVQTRLSKAQKTNTGARKIE